MGKLDTINNKTVERLASNFPKTISVGDILVVSIKSNVCRSLSPLIVPAVIVSDCLKQSNWQPSHAGKFFPLAALQAGESDYPLISYIKPHFVHTRNVCGFYMFYLNKSLISGLLYCTVVIPYRLGEELVGRAG